MSQIQQLMTLFAGLDRAHGVFAENGAISAPGLSPITKTVLAKPSEEKWRRHLAGECGLGIVPINDDDNCWWGAISASDTTLVPDDFEKRIRQAGLPLMAMWRYDKKGADLYLFLSEPTPARLVQERLREWSAVLGVGGCPVLPKQVSLAVTADGTPQDVGSWQMMPYFGIDTGNTAGFAVNNGFGIALDEFLERATERRISAQQLYDIAPISSDLLKEGPPCLNILTEYTVAGEQRKKVLRNIGIYCKQRYDDWEPKLEELNYALMNPPLLSDELQDIRKTLKRRDIGYTCTERPLEEHCNRSACLRCKYGVGDMGGVDVDISGLTLIKTMPPVWYIDVDGMRMQLETNDLMNQDRFRKRCVETIRKLPAKRKQADWDREVTRQLEQITEIEAPEEAGPEGIFWSHVYRYCTVRPMVKTRDGLLEMSAVYEEDGRLYFRGPGLTAHLDRSHFREFSQSKIWDTLRKGNAKHGQWNVNGNCIQWWSIPKFDSPVDGRPLPPMDDEGDGVF